MVVRMLTQMYNGPQRTQCICCRAVGWPFDSHTDTAPSRTVSFLFIFNSSRGLDGCDLNTADTNATLLFTDSCCCDRWGVSVSLGDSAQLAFGVGADRRVIVARSGDVIVGDFGTVTHEVVGIIPCSAPVSDDHVEHMY